MDLIMNYFSSLIYPQIADDFFTTYWRKKKLHITQSKIDIENLFSTGKLSYLLNTHAYSLSYPEVRMTMDGNPVAVSEYLEEVDYFIKLENNEKKNKISPAKVNSFLSKGASLILSDISEYDIGLQSLVQSISREIDEKLNVVLFFSFPSKRSFYPHKDVPDIFSIQIEGEKKWLFYEGDPTENNDPGAGPPEYSAPAEEVILRGGDVLYIPSGMWHTAMAEGTKPSLSVNLIVGCRQKIDLATQIIEDYLFPKIVKDNYFSELMTVCRRDDLESAKRKDLHALIEEVKCKIKNHLEALSSEEIEIIVDSFAKSRSRFTSTFDHPFDMESYLK